MASFSLPQIQETPDHWGPPASPLSGLNRSVLPEELRDIPFAPFSKADKIGRIADWNANAGASGGDGGRGAGGRGAQGRRDGGAQSYGAGASAFTYFQGNDDATFSVVDNTRATSSNKRGGISLGQMTRGRGGAGGARGGGATGTRLGGAASRGSVVSRGGGRGGFSRGGGGGFRGGRRGGWRDWDRPQRTREPSVAVGQEWEQLEEIDFSRLAKLRLDVGEPEDVSQYGTLYEYDRSYDRISSVRFEKPLQPMDRVRYNPTTSDDPVLQELAAQPPAASAGPVTRIFLTDSILALLMCTTRSVYPWDIVVTRDAAGNIFMDKRDGGAFDYVTVNENAADPPAELETKDETGRDKAAATATLNTPGSLSLEATYINQNFAFQVVNEKKRHELANGPNPFYDARAEKDPVASCGFKYRKFDLSTPSDAVELFVRTEVDAVLPALQKGGAPQYVTIKTLNEFDSRAQGAGGAPDWRTKLDSQRGAVVATEMKNNGVKLARFAVQAILAGADNMKMGYISRANARDASRHVILGTQWYKPREFAAQINVNLSMGWGIVRTVADLARKAKGGEGPAKFVLMKDPNKAQVRFYAVPLAWPAEDDEGDDEEALAEVAAAAPALTAAPEE
ncbi:translation initiation factor eIF-3, subunit D [Acaromyces ingoldii]|uniref:Eukaryotic translation initiation factor 3 subunit D n=1 Tax=Acaromyces ingoldii TaxID=215250 RepID=A0A316YB45_9BASI|nr:translation initiation factor eIF-3, subunit D [Acaromyces ingoldii]PWN86562.1 translation initiation factor eIF-3, subunit D [Acaromyces ingoldii]